MSSSIPPSSVEVSVWPPPPPPNPIQLWVGVPPPPPPMPRSKSRSRSKSRHRAMDDTPVRSYHTTPSTTNTPVRSNTSSAVKATKEPPPPPLSPPRYMTAPLPGRSLDEMSRPSQHLSSPTFRGGGAEEWSLHHSPHHSDIVFDSRSSTSVDRYSMPPPAWQQEDDEAPPPLQPLSPNYPMLSPNSVFPSSSFPKSPATTTTSRVFGTNEETAFMHLSSTTTFNKEERYAPAATQFTVLPKKDVPATTPVKGMARPNERRTSPAIKKASRFSQPIVPTGTSERRSSPLKLKKKAAARVERSSHRVAPPVAATPQSPHREKHRFSLPHLGSFTQQHSVTSTTAEPAQKSESKRRAKTPVKGRARTPEPQKKRAATPQKVRSKTPEPAQQKKRSKTPEPAQQKKRSKTPERLRNLMHLRPTPSSDVSHPPPGVVEDRSFPEDRPRKGFFRNWFRKGRGGGETSRVHHPSMHSHSTDYHLPDSESSVVDHPPGTAPSECSALKPAAATDESLAPERMVDRSHVMVDEDRPELFFAHDDISTLTIPTLEAPSSYATSGSGSLRSASRRRGDDPSVRSGHSSDPMGRYWNGAIPESSPAVEAKADDPFFQEPLFADPVGASPLAKKAMERTKKNLQLDVAYHRSPQQHLDPVGNSPLPSTRANQRRRPSTIQTRPPAQQKFHDPSPRGGGGGGMPAAASPFGSFAPVVRDPVGESPLHQNGRGPPPALRGGSPVVPDPPLYLKALHDSDLVSEGEEESDALNAVDSASMDMVLFGKDKSEIQLDTVRFVNETKHGYELEVGVKVVRPSPRKDAVESSHLGNESFKKAASPTSSPRSKVMKSLVVSRLQRTRPLSLKITRSKATVTSSGTQSIMALPSDLTPKVNNTVSAFVATEEIVTSDVENVDHRSVPLVSPRVGDILQKVKAKSPRYHSKQSPKVHAPVIPTASESSSVFSETAATKKAKQQLYMSKIAQANTNAVAYLQSRNDEPLPNQFWQDAEDCVSEATSSIASSRLYKSDSLFDSLQSSCKDTQPPKSLLFSSMRKGKFKDRKIEKTFRIQSQSNFNEQSQQIESVPLPLTKVESAVSQLQTKLNVKLSNSPARSRSAPIARDTMFSSLYDEGNNSFAPFDPFPSVEPTSSGKNNSFLVDINECFPEFSSSFQKTISSTLSVISPDPVPTTSIESFRQKTRFARNTNISVFAVVKGYELLRQEREYNIATGKSARVILSQVPKVKKSHSKSLEYEPMDPIQRAGRRLLSKAAVPIQAAARRFLAQMEAVDRMWALIEIQSYVRRWRAEVALRASRSSAVVIQALVRGFLVRRCCCLWNQAAATIQKVVRGHLACSHTFDLVHRIVVVQAVARGWVTRFRIRRHFVQVVAAAQSMAAHKIQTWWRSQSSRMLYLFLRYDTIIAQSTIRRFLAKRQVNQLRHQRAVESATKIQAVWRGFHSYSEFIFCLVDIMLIQRALRCWRAKKEVHDKRTCRAATKIQSSWRCYTAYFPYKNYQAAVRIQKTWRRYTACSDDRRYRAAVTIQKEWRCFSTYTDYIFVLADIIRIQNAVRSWLTRKEANSQNVVRSTVIIQRTWRTFRARNQFMASLCSVVLIQCLVRSHLAKNALHNLKLDGAAVTLQKTWRRYAARMYLLNDFVHIILLQTLARRFLARRLTMRLRNDKDLLQINTAATSIQTVWRGFWHYSHFVILRYEVVRIQSIMRGKLCRNDFNLQLGCGILLQAAIRRFLAMRKVHRLKVTDVWTNGRVHGILEKSACSRIQFWWRVVLECRKEKRAALVIERFFLMIKRDIDLEIQRREKMKKDKRKRRHRMKKEDDDMVLERAWLNTVDSNSDLFSFTSGTASDVFDFSPASTPLSIPVSAPLKSPNMCTRPSHAMSPLVKTSDVRTPSVGSRTPKSPALRSSNRGAAVLSPMGSVKAQREFHDKKSSTSSSRNDSERGAAVMSPTESAKTPRESHAKKSFTLPSRQNSNILGSTKKGSRSSGDSSFNISARTDSISHRASSPPKHLVMRHEYDSVVSEGKKRHAVTARTYKSPISAENKDDSALSPLRRAKALTRKKSLDLAENLSLEEAYLDAAIQQGKQLQKSGQRDGRSSRGSKTAPYKSSHDAHFFADDLESIDDGCNFLDDVADAAERLSDFGRTQRTMLSKEFSTALYKTRSSILEVADVLSSRLPSTSSIRRFESNVAQLKNNEPVNPPLSGSRSSRSHKFEDEAAPRSTRSENAQKASPFFLESSNKHHAKASPRTPTVLPSPRHGKILVMNPYPDYPQKSTTLEFVESEEFNGEEFGMI